MTIRIHTTFATLTEAEDYRARYLASYPPAGYGTSLRVAALENGRWAVTGYSYSSCD